MRYLLGILVYSAIGHNAAAQDINTVKIADLTFNCENCQIQENPDSCNLFLKNENIIFPCTQALDYFFSIQKTNDAASQYPTAIELKNYIFSKDKSKVSKTNALILFLKKEDGRKLFIEELAAFNTNAAQYYSEIIPFTYQYQEIWKAVWSSPNLEDPKIDADVRSKIFAYIDMPTGEMFKDTLYPSLIDKSPLNQKEILELYKSNCQGRKNSVAGQISIINNFIENCSETNPIISNEECRELNIQGADNDTITLISKLKFNFILNKIKNGDSFKQQDIINLLSKTNYHIIRTPDSHYMLFKAFESLLKNDYCESRKIYYQYKDLFNEYQKYDPSLNEILNIKSETQCNLIEETLEKRQNNLYYALVIFVLMLLVILVIKRKNKKVISKELQELLEYFNLDINQTDKLQETYHFLAKKFHPDSGTGSDELFKELNEKYERIKILL